MEEKQTSFERNEQIDERTKKFQLCPISHKKNLKTLGENNLHHNE